MSKFRVTFQPETLSQLSRVKICQKLWSQSVIIESIKLELEALKAKYGHRRLLNTQLCDSENEILNRVMGDVDKLPLPLSVKCDLTIVISQIKFVIWDWLDTIQDRRIVDLEEYLCYIKWTTYGDVDEAETVRAMYYANVFPDNHVTFTQLANYCLEDCITDYIERMKSLDCPLAESDFSNMLPQYWINRMENSLDDFLQKLSTTNNEVYEESEFAEEAVFLYSINNYCNSAIKYFWDSFTDDQKIKTFRKFSHSSLNIDTQTFVYLWKPACTYEIDAFFWAMLAVPWIMESFIKWPYDNLLMRLLENSWPQLNDSDLEELLNMICSALDFITFDNLEKLGSIFQQTWQRISAEHKRSMNCIGYLEDFLESMLTLRCIINDAALQSTERDVYIRFVAIHFKSAFQSRDLSEVLYKFCRVILHSKEERQVFRMHF